MSFEWSRVPRIPSAARRRSLRAWNRLRRYLELRRQFDRKTPRQPLFIVGCQRSGTNMLALALERAPEIWVHHESNRSVAFRHYRLRSDETLERLICRSPAPTVAFKPVCDAHLTDRLLERHPRSKAIWIFRDYQDVANSAVRNFGEHQKDIVRWIVQKDWTRLGWRGERLSSESLELVEGIWRDDLLPEEGAALFWFMRNRFYFELELDRDPRVLLLRYEDLVSRPEPEFGRIFDFLGRRLESEVYAPVFQSSIRKNPFPELDPTLEKACRNLEARLRESLSRLQGAPAT